MRIALYVNDNLQQIVITPENDGEKALLKFLEGKEVEVMWGSFYECKGGWVREGADANSAILVLREPR